MSSIIIYLAVLLVQAIAVVTVLNYPDSVLIAVQFFVSCAVMTKAILMASGS